MSHDECDIRPHGTGAGHDGEISVVTQQLSDCTFVSVQIFLWPKKLGKKLRLLRPFTDVGNGGGGQAFGNRCRRFRTGRESQSKRFEAESFRRKCDSSRSHLKVRPSGCKSSSSYGMKWRTNLTGMSYLK